MTFENLEKSEQAARQAYEKDLRLAISCIADVQLRTKWSAESTRWLLVCSPRTNKDLEGVGSLDEDSDFIMLRCEDGSKLYFELVQHVNVIKIETEKGERFRVSTIRYIYAFWRTPDDVLAGWHYHPDLHIKFPHLHVYDRNDEAERKAGCKPFLLHGMHMPTGRVALEDVIKFAIREMKVVPEKNRAGDWEKILAETSTRFEENKTWGSRAPENPI